MGGQVEPLQGPGSMPPQAACAAMATNAAPFLMMCLCLLTCTTFFLQYTIFTSVHHVSERSIVAAGDAALQAGRSFDINSFLQFDHQVDVDAADAVVVPSNDNFYISVKGYVARRRPVQQVEQVGKQQDEPAAYKVVAELARRYRAKYIIDIGCGTAKHLGRLASEFNVIGIDYGINLERARTAFPKLTFIEADLDKDKGCNVALPEDTLFQSVVIAADIIEHLVDPLYCLVRLLRYVSAYASAVVVTSPDRLRLTKAFHWPRSFSGPPINRYHVREWTIDEMTSLFTDVNMHVVLSAWTCGRARPCTSGFSVAKNPYVNQLLVLGNGNVRRVWQDNSLAVNIKVTSFVVVHPKTHDHLVLHTLTHLAKQGVQVYLIQRNCNVTLPSHIDVLASVQVSSFEQTISVIKSAIASKDFRYGDWFIAQDAHEVISVPPMLSSSNLTLAQYLQRVSYSPHSFNAVPLTVISMDSHGVASTGGGSNVSREKLPFKIYAPEMWDDERGRMVHPRPETLRDRVRVWRKTYTGARLFASKAKRTGQVITDVHFLGRQVYPFHLLSMRYLPRTAKPSGALPRKLALMYGLDIGLGYATATRKAIYQTRLPY